MSPTEAISRLREVICRQHKAIATEDCGKDVLGQPLKEVDALRATRPAHLRHAPTLSETRALLLAVRNRAGYPTNLISRMLYRSSSWDLTHNFAGPDP